MKIHLVETAGAADRLVKAHTKAGAERHVRDSIKPAVSARVPTQQELVDALQSGVVIEDATNSPQASTPEPSQAIHPADKFIDDVSAHVANGE